MTIEAELCITRLRELVRIQCSDGNWNYDPYMQGMANGMLLALSLFDDKSPEYLEAPGQWIKDYECDHPLVEATNVEPITAQ